MNEDVKSENLRIHSRADELIACLEGEIAKRDEELAACRVAVENCEVFRARIAELEADRDSHQRYVMLTNLLARIHRDGGQYMKQHGMDKAFADADAIVAELYAAPVSEAKAQGEYGDAYQGAREDLAIWKRRALEAEEKVLQQEQIIDHQGESRFGEPVVTPDAPCVPDGYVLADKKALGTVLQALVNAPHHIRELQVTLQPVELFSDNPINVLIANYEAPAATVQQPKCRTCDDNGLIGGPSFYSPDEGGEPCPDCCSPVQQVSAQDKFCIGAWRDALEKIAKYAPQVNCAARTELERAGLIAVHALIAFSAPQLRPARGTQTASNAAQAAPAADAGHVFYGMDGNHP